MTTTNVNCAIHNCLLRSLSVPAWSLNSIFWHWICLRKPIISACCFSAASQKAKIAPHFAEILLFSNQTQTQRRSGVKVKRNSVFSHRERARTAECNHHHLTTLNTQESKSILLRERKSSFVMIIVVTNATDIFKTTRKPDTRRAARWWTHNFQFSFDFYFRILCFAFIFFDFCSSQQKCKKAATIFFVYFCFGCIHSMSNYVLLLHCLARLCAMCAYMKSFDDLHGVFH